jgi:hypothetical protein
MVLGATVGACGGEEDVRDPVWGYISAAIVQPNCATSSCHSKASAVSGLNLSTAHDGWVSLRQLNQAPMSTGTMPKRMMVLPYNPTESRMVHMLRADGARRMPPDRPLAVGDIELIERWILEGAQEN